MNDENFEVQFEVANFCDKVLDDMELEWMLNDSKGAVVVEGKLDKQEVVIGNVLKLFIRSFADAERVLNQGKKCC